MSIADILSDAVCGIRDSPHWGDQRRPYHPIRYRIERLLGEMNALRIALDHDHSTEE